LSVVLHSTSNGELKRQSLLRLRSALAIVRPDQPHGVVAQAPLNQSTQGGSGSFLVLANDGNRYWCKVLNNGQGDRVPVTEQIVGRLGTLIGAPVCAVELVQIPAALAGWEFRPGMALIEGWAHGSLAADPVIETHSLDHRAMDDNARRHAGICALHDWLGGADPQWLMRGAENEYLSHDHGWYLPPDGPSWTVDTLRAAVDASFQIQTPPAGLDGGELTRLADRLDEITRQDLETELSNIPPDWPVTDEELNAVAKFADSRRGNVAVRLRALAQAV
jgi:hypothetical protein